MLSKLTCQTKQKKEGTYQPLERLGHWSLTDTCLYQKARVETIWIEDHQSQWLMQQRARSCFMLVRKEGGCLFPVGSTEPAELKPNPCGSWQTTFSVKLRICLSFFVVSIHFDHVPSQIKYVTCASYSSDSISTYPPPKNSLLQSFGSWTDLLKYSAV